MRHDSHLLQAHGTNHGLSEREISEQSVLQEGAEVYVCVCVCVCGAGGVYMNAYAEYVCRSAF